MTAPIALFVYNRVDHVEATLNALSMNTLAFESELFIFSDGAKSSKDIEAVNRVRNFVSQDIWKERFKKVNLIFSETNKGLAVSIISGVDKVINEYGSVIVIEDDCVSSVDFLNFMNKCLDFYRCNNKIWSIGGYTMNIDFPNDYQDDVYFMGRTCSYAWATWIDRWKKVDWNVGTYNQFKYNFRKRRMFNLYGDDRSKMLDEQQLGFKNSWAIRFCYAMFENQMYTVYPKESKIKNIGYDVGTHINQKNKDKNSRFNVELKESYKEATLTNDVDVNSEIRKQFASAFKRSKIKLFISYILNVVFKYKRK